VDQQRFRLATRIHFALLRRYAEDVGVQTLMRGGREGREALWVCDACGDAELAALAKDFRRVTQAREAALAAAAPQDAAWARNTSGFGATRAPAVGGAQDGAARADGDAARKPASPPRRLLKPSSWLRGPAH
jgi:hypothetical protein